MLRSLEAAWQPSTQHAWRYVRGRTVSRCSYLEHWRTFPAGVEECEAAQAEGVEFHLEEMPRSILGTEDVNVHGLRCQKTRWASTPVGDDLSLTYLLETHRRYVIDIVLVARKEQSDLSFVPGIEDQRVFQHANDWSGKEIRFTTRPGVFTAGDVASVSPPHRTLLHALTGGYEAAHLIHQYLCAHPLICDSVQQQASIPALQWGHQSDIIA